MIWTVFFLAGVCLGEEEGIPLVSGICLVENEVYKRGLPPGKLTVGLQVQEDALYKLSSQDRMLDAGVTVRSHTMRCYVLCGYRGDSMSEAEGRMMAVLSLGVMPMAMLWRPHNGRANPEWKRFQRHWARPHIAGSSLRLCAL